MAEPFVDLGERLRADAVHPKLRLVAYLNEAGLTQDPQVSRDTGAGDRQQCGQLTHGGGTVAEGVQYGSSARVRQRVQQNVHVACVPQ